MAPAKIVSYWDVWTAYRLTSGAVCSSLRYRTGGSDNDPAAVLQARAINSRMTGTKSWSRATTH
ncbi:MAG TPA: hypothetical protein VJR02_02215 [Pyrinomonadaceae bacterium]|nr:hypothetical protein [Pyrinomonadaceae bacterium]